MHNLKHISSINSQFKGRSRQEISKLLIGDGLIELLCFLEDNNNNNNLFTLVVQFTSTVVTMRRHVSKIQENGECCPYHGGLPYRNVT